MYSYPNPCDTCEKTEKCEKTAGCNAWRTRVRTIWKQFNSYQLRQYRKTKTKKVFAYEHPELARKYLQDGPCKGCQFELLCDVPCTPYWHWWDARMALLRKKYGSEGSDER